MYKALVYRQDGGITSLHTTAKQVWSEKIQAVMLVFMIENNYTAWQACDGKNRARHHIPQSTLRRWKRHYDWWGETPIATARRRGFRKLTGRSGSMPEDHQQALKKIVDENPGYYVDEMQRDLQRVVNVKWHISTIHRHLTTQKCFGGLGYSLKLLTMKAIQASRQERTIYRALLRQVDDPSCLIFLDETIVGKNASRRRRGWGERGMCVQQYELFRGVDKSSRTHNYSMIAAVDINGFVAGACRRVFQKRSKTDMDPTRGTIDGERFEEWVVVNLIPHLGRRILNEPRSTVVMDNATIHKHPRIKALIEKAGAEVIWTAAYSRDLNPIERCFALYKRYLRRRYRAFMRNQNKVHKDALRYCVNSSQMRNLYNGKAMQGCIRNVCTQDENDLALAYYFGVFE